MLLWTALDFTVSSSTYDSIQLSGGLQLDCARDGIYSQGDLRCSNAERITDELLLFGGSPVIRVQLVDGGSPG